MARPRKNNFVFAHLEYRKMDTCRSENKVLQQIHNLLDNLQVAPDERLLPTDALSGKAALQFVIKWKENNKEYSAYIQKISTRQEGLANNLAAIHLWLDNRCLNIRRGVETPGEAFGAHLVEGSNVPASWGEHILGFKLKLLPPAKGEES